MLVTMCPGGLIDEKIALWPDWRARAGGAKGNLIPDAYYAALAIETGSEWITTDRDFSRFKKLRWSAPK